MKPTQRGAVKSRNEMKSEQRCPAGINNLTLSSVSPATMLWAVEPVGDHQSPQRRGAEFQIPGTLQ
jgi:hypothetical protein